jgi:DNA-binding SARP family transcriptional activator
MTYLANVWVRPQAGSGEFAAHYNLGRGALANEDWHAALDAFSRAAAVLRDHGDWPGLWLCQVGLATTAWRNEDGEAALGHAREAHVLADRVPGVWPRVWSLWLLGHLYAAHHQQVEAAACFNTVFNLLDPADDDQQMIRHLAVVAALLCADGDAEPEMLVERLFGLARIGCQIARNRGLPVEALLGPSRAPRLSRAAHTTARGPIEWLLNMLPRGEPAPPRAPEPPPASPPPAPAAPPALPADDRTPDLRAYCLGSFEVWLGHSLVTQWTGTKSKTLLKLLLASFPSMVPATTLMDALWRGVDEDLARQRLHTASSDLRRALRAVRPEAGALIVSQAGSYGLDPRARIWIDRLEFERARRAGQQLEQLGRLEEAGDALCQAVALYRGEYLEEEIYEDWPTEQREQLKSEYLTALTRLSQWAFAAGDYDGCLSWCRLTLECDPCREDAHRLLMRSYCRLGQRSAAIRQYRQCVEALRRELDAVPEAESDELYERLRQGQEI